MPPSAGHPPLRQQAGEEGGQQAASGGLPGQAGHLCPGEDIPPRRPAVQGEKRRGKGRWDMKGEVGYEGGGEGGPYGVIWGHMGLYGDIWGLMGLYGDIWA